MSLLKKNLIDTDGNMYLTVDSLIKINDITGSNNTAMRKVNVKPYGFDEIYMDKDVLEDQLYQTIDQLYEKEITPVKFNTS